MARGRHVHRVRKTDLSRDKEPYLIYVCVKTGCTYRERADLLEGKEIECSQCNEKFVMDKNSMQVYPRCAPCRSKFPYHKSKKMKVEPAQPVARVSPTGNTDALLDSLLPDSLKGVK